MELVVIGSCWHAVSTAIAPVTLPLFSATDVGTWNSARFASGWLLWMVGLLAIPISLSLNSAVLEVPSRIVWRPITRVVGATLSPNGGLIIVPEKVWIAPGPPQLPT